MTPYRLLDPLLRRLPWRWEHRLEPVVPEGVAGVELIWTSRLRGGRPVMPVAVYRVGDTLVDTGIAGCAAGLVELARERKVRRALLTHHHEDHVGGAAALAVSGIELLAGPATAALVARSLPVKLYQHLLWGPAESVACATLGKRVELGELEAEVIAAPGHAVDQAVFFVRERGWLFSGDVFVTERVQVFRADEDFGATVATLEHLAALDFDTLLCAHRPVLRDGRAALRRKLANLRELEAEVREQARRGLGASEIAHRLRRGPTNLLLHLSFGDVSTGNLVRAILTGPRPRREVVERLEKACLSRFSGAPATAGSGACRTRGSGGAGSEGAARWRRGSG